MKDERTTEAWKHLRMGKVVVILTLQCKTLSNCSVDNYKFNVLFPVATETQGAGLLQALH